MDLRLNKIISDSGLCSRREADRFIEMGRVTVNGKQPEVGVKITEKDVVMVDGFQINMDEHMGGVKARISGKTRNLMFGDKPLKREDLIANRENAEKEKAEYKASDRKPAEHKPSDRTKRKLSDQKPIGRKPADGRLFEKKSTLYKPVIRKSAERDEEAEVTFEKRPGKYGKYNKYAAARHASREGGVKPKSAFSAKEKPDEARLVKEAFAPKFGKSLSRSAVAQRIAASPKSASLRKTSKNNPTNKSKRVSGRNKPKDE